MDNTVLPSGGGGDTIRTLDKTGTGVPKTQVSALDLGGGDGRSEFIATQPLPAALADVPVDDDGNPFFSLSPSSMDALEMLFRQTITAVGQPYPQTAAEIVAGVTPVNMAYPELNVLRYGAKGNDSTDNVTAFAQAKLVASQYEFTTAPTIFFPAGTYRVATPTNWFLNNTGITLQTLGEVIIKGTGTSGHVMEFDAGVSLNGTHCFMLGDWTLDSTNQGAAVGLYTRNVSHSTFQVKVRNVTTSGVEIAGAVRNNYRIVCSTNEEAMTTIPTNGLLINGSAILSQSSDCFFDVTLEGLTGGTGVNIGTSGGCAFSIFIGTSEGNGTGVLIPAYPNGFNNTFIDFDLEANTVVDWDVAGRGNMFINCIGGSLLNPGSQWRAAASNNTWQGGTLSASGSNPAVNIAAGALNNNFLNFYCTTSITDAGTGSTIWGIQIVNTTDQKIALNSGLTNTQPVIFSNGLECDTNSNTIALVLGNLAATATNKKWCYFIGTTFMQFATATDAGAEAHAALEFDRSGATITSCFYGNGTDNPTHNFLGTGITTFAGKVALAAGTTAIAPLQFTSGTNLTTAVAGVNEYDGTCRYFSPAASSRAVAPSEYIEVISAAYTLTSQTAAQKLLNATTNGAVTLPIGTYEFECAFTLTSLNVGTSSVFGFALGGAATFTQGWWAHAAGAALATPNTIQGTYNTAANVAIVGANTTGVGHAMIKGIIRVTVAGTVIPQVSLNTAAAAIVGANSYFRAWSVGNGTVTNVGNWS